MPTGTKGIWPKARLWSPRLGSLTGPVLFMDLDLVVVGSLDGFFTHGDPEAVILARNPNTPLERLGQTSIFRFPVGSLVALQERFVADPQGVADTYRFEQRYVTREAPGGVAYRSEPLFLREPRDSLQIDQLEHRVGGGLDPDQLGLRSNRRRQGVHIRQIDIVYPQPGRALPHPLEQPEAPAIEIVRRHHMVAGIQRLQQRRYPRQT